MACTRCLPRWVLRQTLHAKLALCQLAGPPNVACTRCLPRWVLRQTLHAKLALCKLAQAPSAAYPRCLPNAACGGPFAPHPQPFCAKPALCRLAGPPNVAYSHCLPPMPSVLSPSPNHSVLSVPRASWQGHPIWPVPTASPNAACVGPFLPQPFCAKPALCKLAGPPTVAFPLTCMSGKPHPLRVRPAKLARLLPHLGHRVRPFPLSASRQLCQLLPTDGLP